VTGGNADAPPLVPVALDAYRQWDKWAQQRIGVRAYLRSTYDRTGHNRTADASHYLYQEAEAFNVTLDVEGSGVLYFVRTNRWHGSPWHYEIDGVDHIVEESTTRDPTQPLDAAVFLPSAPFPSPLTYTYATTRGADLNWVPMPFLRRLRLAYSRTFYGTGYYIYHHFVPGLPLSQPLLGWDGDTVPDRAVLDLLSSAGVDIAPGSDEGAIRHTGTFSLRAGATTTIFELRSAPGIIRYFEISAPAARAVDFGCARLTITWDDRADPSVDAPLDLLFGAGTLHNPDGREWLVKALPMAIRFSADRVVLTCQFPMPFFRSARFDVVAGHDGAAIDVCGWALRRVSYDGPWNHVGYFHATYRDHGVPRFGEDLTFLDTHGIEREQTWSGSLVGTSFVFTDRNVLTTLEGDPRFFFDDSQTPQAQGTGTEEWGGGGDYWGGQTMTLPLAGHPVGVPDAAAARDPKDLIHSAYRFLLADLMPFGRRARICFEHGGENESVEHYRSVTHWYGLPDASLVLSDTLLIGDSNSERLHRYASADACTPYSVTSRYEWGPDHLSPSIGHPLAEPDHWVDYEFNAPAGRHRLWIELVTGEDIFDAAVWVQVNSDIDSAQLREAYMGSAGFRNVGRSPGTLRFQTAVAPASVVEFERTGRQRIRIQPRVGRAVVGRVLMSSDRTTRPTADVAARPDEILLTQHAICGKSDSVEVRADQRIASGAVVAFTAAPTEIEIYPAQTMQGRRTLGTSEFVLEIRPDNHGVMLRRTLDYHYANQRARVSVATETGWESAGIWFLAGSNTVYHSFPLFDGELGASDPRIITSNRRFRDDEFLLPVRLTRGRSQIRLKIEFAPRNPPLLPRRAPEPTAWTEFAYYAYCVVMPRVVLADAG
jgi:D-arabinan exo alpha-(1,3)/(1,5)-arabinofuranosidase (non-reducing end)